MSEEPVPDKPSMAKRVIDDIKNDFTNIKDKLSGHVDRAERME